MGEEEDSLCKEALGREIDLASTSNYFVATY
jgi:hypothetical protein